MIKIIKLALLLFLMSACKSNKDIKYSFFIAGHTYGKPGTKAFGIYKPFKDKFKFIKDTKTMKFGVLTGDVVRQASARSWDLVDNDLKELNFPIHFARGNHDGALSFFEKRYGKTYKSFSINNDLHIILDSNLSKWNIIGEQLAFLKEKIATSKSKNIFIYVHHIIWWDKEKFYIPYMNSKDNMPEKFTFWEELFPLLKKTNKPIYLFAGDVGAFDSKHKRFQSYSYIKKDNVSLITSGMGGGKKDNFIIVNILNDNSVQFQLIHLNGDSINGLGKLENYEQIYKK